VQRPSLSDLAITHVEHNRLQAVKPAPLPFALRDVHPETMLVAGHSIMQGCHHRRVATSVAPQALRPGPHGTVQGKRSIGPPQLARWSLPGSSML
jgi:hypothetical protein